MNAGATRPTATTSAKSGGEHSAKSKQPVACADLPGAVLEWEGMDITTALADLGVTAGSLGDETWEQLDRDGYALLEGVLSGQRLTVMRGRLAELLAAEGERAGLEVHQEAGTDRLAD